jgi:hypothetical protein
MKPAVSGYKIVFAVPSPFKGKEIMVDATTFEITILR